MLVKLLVFSNLTLMWKIPQIPQRSTHASKKDDLAAKSFLQQKMSGSERKLSNNSNKHSILERQLQGGPLTKQDILDIYSDVFTRIGKFPGMPYKFQLKPNAKPTRHAPRKVPIHLQDAFHKEIRNLEQFGNSWRDHRCDRMGQQLCDHGEEDSNQLQQQSRDTLWTRSWGFAWILETWMRLWRENLITHGPLRSWANFMAWQGSLLLISTRDTRWWN